MVSKTFALGDIHGGYKALIQCLERSGFDKEKDTLIQLGDVADGWGETSECVDELLTIPNLIQIQGNHDYWVYEWFAFGLEQYIWTSQGGMATIRSYERSGKLYDEGHQKFWRDMQRYYVDDKNRLFIHGGYGGDGLQATAENYPKDLWWNRTLWDVALSGANSQKPPKRLREFETIFIGHTSIGREYGGKPHKACNVWNLDTGGGYEGYLTIMDADTEEYWQSDKLSTIYDKHG